jgi:DNA mismatch repair ATPase MutS
MPGDAKAVRQPFCGFPLPQLERHLACLVKQHGHKVALYEEYQPHVVDKAKLRRLQRIFTPGTLVEEGFLDPESSTYIFAIHPLLNGSLQVCYSDLSTGEVFEKELNWAELQNELKLVAPAEVLMQHNEAVSATATEELRKLRTVISYLGATSSTATIMSARTLLEAYISKCMPLQPVQLGAPLVFRGNQLGLDATAITTLEVAPKPHETHATVSSLYRAVKFTLTAGGGRLLKWRLRRPVLQFSGPFSNFCRPPVNVHPHHPRALGQGGQPAPRTARVHGTRSSPGRLSRLCSAYLKPESRGKVQGRPCHWGGFSEAAVDVRLVQ